MTRWQLELLLLDLEHSRTITQILEQLAKFEVSVNTIAQTVEKLPDDVRLQLDTTLADIDRMQPQLQQTLNDAQLALEQTDKVVKSIDTAAQSLNVTADTVNTTATTV